MSFSHAYEKSLGPLRQKTYAARPRLGPARLVCALLLLALFRCAVPGQTALSQTNSINLGWGASASPGIAGYRLYYGAASGNYTNTATLGNVLTNSVSGLTAGITYYFALTAIDTNGVESLFSNEISYKPGQPVNAPLHLDLTGLGTVTGATNLQVLSLGTNYTLAAKPAPGFKFSQWTSNLLPPTNSAVFKFLMQSGLSLTANFLDTNRPTLSITNLVAGQRLSTGVFTVKGQAADNWQVAGVNLQLNYGGWTNAVGSNSWAGVVALRPGTNTVQAYAVDPGGNVSGTNQILVQYVVTSRLQLAIAGKGTVSPNYSNAWLNVGQNYQLTATPAKGFVFKNWAGGWTTNKSTLIFMMQSNLSLTATFAETTLPTLSITAPANNTRLGSNSMILSGKAADIWGVNNVSFSVNGGAWNTAITANHYTNWTATVSLATGTNTLRVCAQNLGGLYSLTNTLKVIDTNQILSNLSMNVLTQPPVRAKIVPTLPVANTGFAFKLELSAGATGHIEYSTDLQHWTTWTNFESPNTTIQFNDPQAGGPRRFYRAVIP